MPSMRAWIVVVGCLLAAGAALAWADAVVLHPFLPAPPTTARFLARKVAPGAVVELPLPGFGIGFRTRDGFGYGWVLATAAVLGGAVVIAMALAPRRVRAAVERAEAPGGLLVVVVAGAVTTLLVVTASLLLRYTFLLVGLAPVLWVGALVALVFGLAGLGVYAGRRLQRRIGAAPPLLAGLAGVVLVLDIALIPYAGWAFAGLVVITAIGLAVVTRFGSPDGWSLDALDWPINDSTT